MTILGISGSLRRDSHNTRALRAAADWLGEGVALEVWEGLKAIPPYDEDDDGPAAPAAVAELRSAIAGADAVLFATPEYNASIPGQLKNALDWVSRPLATNELRNGRRRRRPVIVLVVGRDRLQPLPDLQRDSLADVGGRRAQRARVVGVAAEAARDAEDRHL